MLPNVRLMIAATLASVVALVCGFGLFAVFRVSHEPFVRSPAGTAALQLVADNTYASTGLASDVPFDRHLQLAAEPSAATTTDLPAASDEQEAEAQAAPAPESGVTPLQQALSETGEATEQPATAAAPTSEAPAADADRSSTSDAAESEAPTRPEATFATTARAAETAPLSDTTTVAADQETRPTAVSIADVGPAFGGAAVAVNGPQYLPPASKRVAPSSAPTDAAGPSGERERKAAIKKPKRLRVAIRIRRVQPVAVYQYAAPQYAQTQYAPTTEQNFGAANLQMASYSQAQYFATPAARVRYLTVVARKPKAPTRDPNTGIGGPFVSATSR
jgi:hypothetical protein